MCFCVLLYGCERVRAFVVATMWCSHHEQSIKCPVSLFIYPFPSPSCAINKFFIILLYISYPTLNDARFFFFVSVGFVCVCERERSVHIHSMFTLLLLQIFLLTMGLLDDGVRCWPTTRNIISGIICGRRVFFDIVVIFCFFFFLGVWLVLGFALNWSSASHNFISANYYTGPCMANGK